MTTNDITQEQADRLAKWRWGEAAYASYGNEVYRVWRDNVISYRSYDSFACALRASMQSPMTDKDAELEAKLRWGMDAHAHCGGFKRSVVGAEGSKGWCSIEAPWEHAFEDADRKAGVDPNGKPWKPLQEALRCPSGYQCCMLCGHGVAGRRTREYTGRLTFIGACNFGAERCYGFADGTMFEVSEWDLKAAYGAKCTRVDNPKVGDDLRMVLAAERACDRARDLEVIDPSGARSPVAHADLTQPAALTEAKTLWGERAYALPRAGEVPCAVGCPGVARGEGATFRAALMDAAYRALATAFGSAGCAAVRERNKAVGQAIMEPPEWAYPAGWRNAVMAAVEWGNAQPAPMNMSVGALRTRVEAAARKYHHDRLTMCETAARQHGPLAAVVCAAYERGRPGGGR